MARVLMQNYLHGTTALFKPKLCSFLANTPMQFAGLSTYAVCTSLGPLFIWLSKFLLAISSPHLFRENKYTYIEKIRF